MSNEKTCRECGKDSVGDARFCGYCGNVFSDINLMSLIPAIMAEKETDGTIPEGASGVEIDENYNELIKNLTWGEGEEEVQVEIEEPPPPEVIPVKIVSSEIFDGDNDINIDWRPSPWKLQLFIGFLGVSIFLVIGYVVWESFINVPVVQARSESSLQKARPQAQASKRAELHFPRPPRNLVLKQPTYQGSVNNIFREGQRLWWQSDYFACVAVFGEDVSPTFIPGRLIRQGEWRGWQFAELRGRGDRFLFLSVCGAGWNTYISEIPPDSPEHLGQAVVQDGIRAYYRAPP